MGPSLAGRVTAPADISGALASLHGGQTLGVLVGQEDAVVFDSYRQHQILPFEGTLDRVSATLHAAHVDRTTWESWF